MRLREGCAGEGSRKAPRRKQSSGGSTDEHEPADCRPAGRRAGWKSRMVYSLGYGRQGRAGRCWWELTGVGRYCPMGCGRQVAARPGGAASGGRAGRFRSMSMAAGRCPAEGTAKASPVRPTGGRSSRRAHRSTVGLLAEHVRHVRYPCILRTPWSSPFPTLGPPARTRKTPPPRPASRARPPPPPPDVRTRPVSTRQGRVRKMIPVTVCGACRPEVLWLLHYPASVRQGQYPCGRIRRIFLSFP